MATLGTTFVGAWAAMGGKKSSDSKGPAIQASSKDEEKFIRYVESAARCNRRGFARDRLMGRLP